MKKTAIYDKQVNENYSSIAIAFPNVKVGTVVNTGIEPFEETIPTLKVGSSKKTFLAVIANTRFTCPAILNIQPLPHAGSPSKQKQPAIARYT